MSGRERRELDPVDRLLEEVAREGWQPPDEFCRVVTIRYSYYCTMAEGQRALDIWSAAWRDGQHTVFPLTDCGGMVAHICTEDIVEVNPSTRESRRRSRLMDFALDREEERDRKEFEGPEWERDE